jgi:predicted MFS family arabinose efflux permease
MSTTLFGLIAQTLGRAGGFFIMALVGCVAFAIVWALMPETKHSVRPA